MAVDTQLSDEGDIATTEHGGKRLVCMCLFGDNPLYTEGAIANASLVPEVYPGFASRIYVADDVPSTTVTRLKGLAATEVVGFARAEWPGRAAQLIRFLPAGEVSCAVAIVRDTDSRVNPREAAAVAEWLATPQAQYHLMHEAMHDDRYGPIMGGMWGARRLTSEPGDVPCPGMAEAVQNYRRQGLGSDYGDDMQFLKDFLSPRLSDSNYVHHADGDTSRFHFLAGTPAPFPHEQLTEPRPYLGFVGQPITCSCPPALFRSEGCPHVSAARIMPGGVASRLTGNNQLLIQSFLG